MEVVFPRTRGIRRKVQFKSIYLNHPPQGNSTDSSTNYSPLSSSSFLSGGRLWHHFHSVGQGSDYSPAIWPGRLSQTSLSLAENSGCLTWVRHSRCQSSSAHSYQCSVAAFSCVQTVVRLPLFGICNVRTDVTYAQTLMHVITQGNCTDTIRESVLKADTGREKKKKKKKKLPHRGFEPATVLRLAFQPDALPSELSPSLHGSCGLV